VSALDGVGFVAAGLVFAAFGMKEMAALRIVAMCSNLAFIVYGVGLDLMPVWLLHAVLLPLNGWRLRQALKSPGPDCQPSRCAAIVLGWLFHAALGSTRGSSFEPDEYRTKFIWWSGHLE
jgi:hypothetical protein